MAISICIGFALKCLRSNRTESTDFHSVTEDKNHRACSVLRSGTAWEEQILQVTNNNVKIYRL